MLLGTKRIFSCVSIGIGMIASFCLYRSMHSASYIVAADDIFSASMVTKLSDYVTHHADFSTKKLCNKLKEEFQEIKECYARLYADGKCVISVEAKKPLISLNSAFVLTYDGTSIERVSFHENGLSSLETIAVQQALTTTDGQALAAYIKSIPTDYLSKYEVCWKNKHEIAFYDKERKVLFLTDVTTLPNEAIHQSLNEIIHGMKTLPNKKQKQLVADIRFEHQLIIYEKRGAYHGNSIF